MRIPLIKKIKKVKKKHFHQVLRIIFWFLIGASLGIFFVANFAFFIFQRIHSNTVYPGVIIENVNFGGKTKEDVRDYFAKKSLEAAKAQLILTSDAGVATVSAETIDLSYNKDLLADQAFSIGRSDNTISNLGIILQGYMNGVFLSPSYTYSKDKLKEQIYPLTETLEKKPVDALFQFENGRVTAFRPSTDGQTVDFDSLNTQITSKIKLIMSPTYSQTIIIPIPVETLKPTMTTDKVNNLGIQELIGIGTSSYYHSIPNRIFNIFLASSRLNGILVAPNEVFSFNKALGDVSSFTGYQQAYVIQNGRTVLGDGGGVCQVSTTLFRALLNAGLPIVERRAHAYRVGYYEQDSAPGIDATVYAPSVDLKFKNDTGHYILIQTFNDQKNLHLTFALYGTKDGRESIIGKPVITNQSPPPPALYQDDPTLPKGQVKQVDFAAWGANVYFTRKVIKDNKTVIDEKFVSNYRPWQDVFLNGTKE